MFWLAWRFLRGIIVCYDNGLERLFGEVSPGKLTHKNTDVLFAAKLL